MRDLSADTDINESQAARSRMSKMNPQISLEGLSLDLRGFLRQQQLTHLAPQLTEAELTDLNSLLAFDLSKLEGVDPDTMDKLSTHKIQKYQQHCDSMKGHILGDQKQHFIFLSHSKLDAGTEAALMVSEIGKLLKDHPYLPGANYESPVFLDSENLQDLTQLQEQVRNCAYLVFMCTTHVLTRPWCLVEIVTAMEANVPILPMTVQKPGNDFAFPNSEFYERLGNGEILDEAAMDTLRDCGIDLETTVKAIKHMFKTIALPYSPHKSKIMRETELKAMLFRLQPERDSAGNYVHRASSLATGTDSASMTRPATPASRRSLSSVHEAANV